LRAFLPAFFLLAIFDDGISLAKVVYGVKSSDLVPLEEFKTDILVCKEGWVGMVRSVKARLTLRFKNLSFYCRM
jgi:hypothetical protein